MTKQQIEAKTEQLLLPIVQREQFELVDVEYVKEGADWYLRAFIDKEGGININDCELVSRELDPLLEEANVVDGAFILEVSSPGLTRPLKKEKDYIRNLGKPVEIRTFKAVDGSKQFIGDLLRYDKDSVTLDVGAEQCEEITIQKSNISVIKQYFEF